jgi:uncharacterized protein GlcG (DUF336 family)
MFKRQKRDTSSSLFSRLASTVALFPFLCLPAVAQDSHAVRQIGMELARDIAVATMDACRQQGYVVSVVVLDRAGNIQVALRDTMAPRYTLEMSERKAGLTIATGAESAKVRNGRGDIRPEVNTVSGLIMLEGGLPIRAGNLLLGAVGVSGAPGGDKDAACAASALKMAEARLEAIK